MFISYFKTITFMLICALGIISNANSFNLEKLTDTNYSINSIVYKEILDKPKLYITANDQLLSISALYPSIFEVEYYQNSFNIAKSNDLNNLFITNQLSNFNNSYEFSGNKRTSYNNRILNLYYFFNYNLVDVYYTNQNIFAFIFKPSFDKKICNYLFINTDNQGNNEQSYCLHTAKRFNLLGNSNDKNSIYFFGSENALYQARIDPTNDNLNITQVGNDIKLDMHTNNNITAFEIIDGNKLFTFTDSNIFLYTSYPKTDATWKNLGSVGNTKITAMTKMKYTNFSDKSLDNTVYFITTEGDIYAVKNEQITHINNTSSLDPRINGLPINIIAYNNVLYITTKVTDKVYNIYKSDLTRF